MTVEQYQAAMLEIITSVIKSPDFNVAGSTSNPNEAAEILVDFADAIVSRICKASVG